MRNDDDPKTPAILAECDAAREAREFAEWKAKRADERSETR
jgi:hypothetical protein